MGILFFPSVPDVKVDENTITNDGAVGFKIVGKKIYSGSGWNITGLQSGTKYKGRITSNGIGGSDGFYQLALNGGSVLTAVGTQTFSTSGVNVNSQNGFGKCTRNVTGNILFFELEEISGKYQIKTWCQTQDYYVYASTKIVTIATLTQLTFTVPTTTTNTQTYYLEEWV